MKSFGAVAVAVFAMFLLVTGMAWADVSKHEKNLDREAKRLSDTAAKPDGEKAVIRKIEQEFKVTGEQAQALRDRKLAYGEIAVIYSLAQSLPGGVTEENVQKVLSLRQGPPPAGWGEVAGKLGIKLGKTISRIKKLTNDANREIKKDHARSEKAKKTPPQQEQKPEKKEPPMHNYEKGEGRSLPHGRGAQ